MRRVLYGDVETKAKALLAEETSRMSVARRTGRKAFEGFAGQGGKLQVKRLEALQAIRAGGIAAHGKTLQLLMQMTSGHEIVKNPDTGALEIAYINPSEFGPEHAKVIENYNIAARQFANTPETWGYSRASKKEHAQHEAAQLQYDNARRTMFAVACAKEGDFATASEFMLQRDSQVKSERILAGCPQLEAVLGNVERIEKQSHRTAAAWSTGKESGLKGTITGGSFLTRYASITLLGLSATPIAMGIGAAINSVRGAYQARTKAREEFLTAQQDLTRIEKNALKVKGGRQWFGFGKKEKARLAGHAFRRGDFIDASEYNKRMEKLLERVNDPANEKNEINQRHLYQLVNMAEAHLAEGLVNFGKGNTRLAAAYEFSTNLAEARMELARKDWTGPKKAVPSIVYLDAEQKRHQISLPALMNAKLGRMSKEEKKFILRGFTRGLAVGAVAGGVGALVGGWIRDRFGFGGSKTPLAPENLPVAPKANVPTNIPPLPTTETPAPKIPATGMESPHTQPSQSPNPDSPHTFKPTHDAFPYPEIPVKPTVEAGAPLASAPSTEIDPSGLGDKIMKGSAVFPHLEDSTPATSPSLEGNPEYAKLAEIKKGEGIWHAVRRQLNYQMSHSSPEEFTNRYGLTAEDIQQHPKESVERITGKLLVDQDYIKPNGRGSEQLAKGKNTYQWRKPGTGAWTETRIAKPGVHVILGEDGKIEISDTGKTIPETPPNVAKSPQPPEARPNISNEALFAAGQETVTLGETPRVPSNVKEALDSAERAMSKAEAAASKAEASMKAQKAVSSVSPSSSTPSTNVPPAYGGREGDFTSPASTPEARPNVSNEALFAAGQETTATGKAQNGFAPDTAPATQTLTDAQREAMQLDYQGLPEKGMGEVVGGTKKVSPIDPMGLGDQIMKGSGVFPQVEDVTSPASAPTPVEIAPETTPLSEPITHAIGKRGPEGAIIDEFRNNPELAKQFGWDGKKNINTWAGKEVDVLYKAFRKESLGNPKIVEEMERLGYKPTLKGHESMMHRIKSGTIELDPTTKSLTLKDVNIIKASETMTLLSEVENTTRKMAGIPLDTYADIRDTTLTEFLKKTPRGKGFKLLASVLHGTKPTKADMQKSIGEYLTNLK